MTAVTVEKHYPLFSVHSTRLVIGLLLTWGLASTVSMRLNLSMAVVCMVNSTAVAALDAQSKLDSSSHKETHFPDDSCPAYSADSEAASKAGYNGTLLWSPQMQSWLFSTTFYGAMALITVSGYLADRYGPKMILLGAALDYVIVTLLTPTLAKWSYPAFFVSRVIMGLGEGFMFPCLASVTAKWYSPYERSTIAAMYTSGNQISASLTSLISASLCASQFGWESIFYLLGLNGIIWCIVWYIVATNRPSENKWISKEEKEYLSVVAPQGLVKKPQKVPWRHVVGSVPLLSAVLCNFAYCLQAAFFQSFLPSYLKEVLRLPLQTNGIYAMIPFVTQLISKNIFAISADYMKRKKILGQTQCAKIFQALGSFGPAICMIALVLIPSCHNPWTAAVILAIYGLVFSGNIVGYFTAILCMAPAYTGTLSSISMTFCILGSLSGPTLLSLLHDIAGPNKWNVLFVIFAIVNLISGSMFMVFGTADVQPWGHHKVEPRRTSKENIEEEDVYKNKD